MNCILEVQMPSVSAFFSKMEVVIVRFQQLELCCLRLYADLWSKIFLLCVTGNRKNVWLSISVPHCLHFKILCPVSRQLCLKVWRFVLVIFSLRKFGTKRLSTCIVSQSFLSWTIVFWFIISVWYFSTTHILWLL